MSSRYDSIPIIVPVDAITGLPTAPMYLDLREPITSVAADDKWITAGQFKRWDTLGAAYLLDAAAYWAICDLSGIQDPFTELQSGTLLRIPTVQRYLFDFAPPVTGIV